MNKMKEQQFDELLDRYLNKEVSSEEEQELMGLLDDVADEFMPEGMEQRLESFIEDLDDDEVPETVLKPKSGNGLSMISYFRHYAAAACVVLILGIGFAISQTGQQNSYTDTCSTPAEAEAQMLRALTMLNSHSQQGLDEARQRIENPVKQTDYSRFISFE